ncbi:MAG: glycoside hydrolase family 172 protein [Pseudomonadota bacterium]
MRLLLALCLLLLPAAALAQEAPLYQFQPGQEPRWASPENPAAEKGAGARENKGAKGHAFETIAPGASLVLADIRGAGIIDRIWLTFQDRSPEMLRALRLEIWWDGARAPAVSVPLGDFFGMGAGEVVPMETALFASPEGRSFVSYFPMPFRTGARIVVTNESSREVPLFFYDVDFRKLRRADRNMLYFHAFWRRERATRLGEAFEVLPRVEGRGRYLGAAITIFADPGYGKSWWGEGEVKIYLDGDRDLPTLAGTGTEDYIGSGWGQGAYVNRFQGSPVADEARGRWSFYRLHVPDPIFFARDIRVTLQQIGGAMRPEVLRMQAAGVPLQPVTVDPGGRKGFRQLLATDPPASLAAPGTPEGWTNFYRSDDVAAVAWFYLDRPGSTLPALAPVADRTGALRSPAPR